MKHVAPPTSDQLARPQQLDLLLDLLVGEVPPLKPTIFSFYSQYDLLVISWEGDGGRCASH